MQQLSSKNRLSISNFTLTYVPSRCMYLVTFFSTKTNKSWGNYFSYVPMVFHSKICPNPKQKDLITLKKLCKNGNN